MPLSLTMFLHLWWSSLLGRFGSMKTPLSLTIFLHPRSWQDFRGRKDLANGRINSYRFEALFQMCRRSRSWQLVRLQDLVRLCPVVKASPGETLKALVYVWIVMSRPLVWVVMSRPLVATFVIQWRLHRFAKWSESPFSDKTKTNMGELYQCLTST